MGEKLRKLLALMFNKSTKNKPNLRQKVSYPHKGSLDANFQDFVKKQGLLNNKGWGFKQSNTPIIKKDPVKSTRPSEQLKLDLKRGGCVGPNGIL